MHSIGDVVCKYDYLVRCYKELVMMSGNRTNGKVCHIIGNVVFKYDY